MTKHYIHDEDSDRFMLFRRHEMCRFDQFAEGTPQVPRCSDVKNTYSI